MPALFLAFMLLWPPAGDALRFELNFDRSGARAGLSEGKPEPIQVFGTVSLRDGLQGKALFCGDGGASLRFASAGNLNFDKPGSLSFWFFPLDWDADHRYRCFFFGTESSQGYFGIQQANDPKDRKPYDRDLQLMILYSKTLASTVVALPPFGKNALGRWHLIAANWDAGSVALSLDGQDFSVWQLKGRLDRTAIPSEHFSVGSSQHWNYLLDEFRIYSRKLTAQEVQDIYQQGLQKVAKKGSTLSR
ncbi:MAG: LamG domain-containing protein [Lentisphaeria bacterium]|nr:LamG domain-containing protein [Lentisphaeria bacterium]